MNRCDDCGYENRVRDLTTFEGVTRCPDCHEDMLARENPDHDLDHEEESPQGSALVIGGGDPVHLEWRASGQALTVDVTDNRRGIVYRLHVPAPGGGEATLLTYH